jgi:hypothetical protein
MGINYPVTGLSLKIFVENSLQFSIRISVNLLGFGSLLMTRMVEAGPVKQK